MNRVFADRAWLGPGMFARRVLVEFDAIIHSVRELSHEELPPPDAEPVQWLIPGFVNAHCHLEYSWLRDESAALPAGPVPFGEWLQAIIGRRPQTDADFQRRAEAMAEAARELIAGGCTTVIDSTTDGASEGPLAQAGLRHFLFHEVLGLSQQRAEESLENALQELEATDTLASPLLLGRGLNPHAPYSVGPWLRQRLLQDDLAGLPRAWHLAETADEEELYRSGTGSIADFLQRNQMPLPYDKVPARLSPAPGLSSFGFLEAERQIPEIDMAFHGNYLSPAEASFFVAPRALVHCPGTHRWFGRPQVLIKEWLDAGVNMCLGTDSLASSFSLSMLSMIKATLADNPELTDDDALRMACSNPAAVSFLKEKGFPGTIEAAKAADLVALKTQAPASPLRDESTCVSSVWIGGTRKI